MLPPVVRQAIRDVPQSARRRAAIGTKTGMSEAEFVTKHESDPPTSAFRAWVFINEAPVRLTTPSRPAPVSMSPTTSTFLAEIARWRGSEKWAEGRAELLYCYVFPRLHLYTPTVWPHLVRYPSSSHFLEVSMDDIAVATALHIFTDMYYDAPISPVDPARQSLTAMARLPHLTLDKFHDVDMLAPARQLVRQMCRLGYADVLEGLRCVVWICQADDATETSEVSHGSCTCSPCSEMRQGVEMQRLLDEDEEDQEELRAVTEQEMEEVGSFM